MKKLKRFNHHIISFVKNSWAISVQRERIIHTQEKIATWPEMTRYDLLGKLLFEVMGINIRKMIFGLYILATVEEFATRFIERYPRNPIIQIGDIIWDFIIIPALWYFYARSYKQIPSLFNKLNTIIDDGESIFGNYLNSVKRIIASSLWVILSIGLSLFGQAFFFLSSWKVYPPGFYPWTIHVIYSLTLGFLNLYVLSLMIFREINGVRCLDYFFKNFSLRIQILHPDNAGGLEFIGKHYFSLAFLVVIAGLAVSFWSIIIPLINKSNILTEPVWITAWIAYFVLSPTTFFLPLWSGHKSMIRVKLSLEQYVSDHFNDSFDLLKAEFSGCLKLSEDRTEVVRFFKEFKTLLETSFPTWPYSSKIRRMFSFSALLPIVTSLISLTIKYLIP